MGGPGPRLSGSHPERAPGGVGSATGADPPGPVRDVRLAVRAALRPHAGGAVVVGVSGGPDSLALLTAAVAVADPLAVRVHAVCVDHGWHPRTAAVAVRVARAALALGAGSVRVVRVVPARSPGGGWAGGPEEAARTSRLRALEAAAARDGAGAVLLGHTLDDQAEQVLLGLARGSGARSLAGMPARRGLLVRPLLGLRRDAVRAACPVLPELGLPWQDPSNTASGPTGAAGGDAPPLLRAAVRDRLLPVLAEVLGAAAPLALARSADLLREDADALDAWAGREVAVLLPHPAPDGAVDVALAPLLALPVAVRGRVLRLLVAAVGARSLARAHTRALEELVTGPAGRGEVCLPGGVRASRTSGPDGCGRLSVAADPPP